MDLKLMGKNFGGRTNIQELKSFIFPSGIVCTTLVHFENAAYDKSALLNYAGASYPEAEGHKLVLILLEWDLGKSVFN